MKLARERLERVCRELGSEAPELELIDEAFSTVDEHVQAGSADAVLADFGVSSLQLDEAARGFSFSADGPLDMRMDPRQELTAAQVVNEASERELADLIYQFSDERRSRRIARAIVKGRPVTTTAQLARIVATAAPAMKGDRIHPATRTFQGLRIYLNRELDEIKALLEAAPKLLKPSGRFVAISFHSLRRPAGKGQFAGRRAGGHLDDADEKAGDGRRRRDGQEPAIAQREAESRRKNESVVIGQ